MSAPKTHRGFVVRRTVVYGRYRLRELDTAAPCVVMLLGDHEIGTSHTIESAKDTLDAREKAFGRR